MAAQVLFEPGHLLLEIPPLGQAGAELGRPLVAGPGGGEEPAISNRCARTACRR